MREPFAARLHFIPRLINTPQRALVSLLRPYLLRAPGWVLLRTRGRTTGLMREVLLPCERFDDRLFVISTYGHRSNWMRNIERCADVEVTVDGRAARATAEIVSDLGRKQALVSDHPFFVPFPIWILNLIHRTILRPVWVPFLRWWVRARPVVVIHIGAAAPSPPAAGAHQP